MNELIKTHPENRNMLKDISWIQFMLNWVDHTSVSINFKIFLKKFLKIFQIFISVKSNQNHIYILNIWGNTIH